MDGQHLKELLVLSAKDVFNKMISLELTENSKAPQSQDLFVDKKHILASIGFAGGWNGSVTFQCSQDFGYILTSKMLFMDVSQLELPDVRDAMGEIVNMVGGKFKACFAENFNQGAEAFKMSVPTVTTGKSFQVFNLKTVSILEVLLASGVEIVALSLALKKEG